MRPVSPIIPGEKLSEIVIAKNQPPYKPISAYRYPDGDLLTRWHMTWKERLTALFTGNVYLWIKTFNRPMQPVLMQVARPITTAMEEEPCEATKTQ